MVLFKDLAKASSDLLSKDFPHDKTWDVEYRNRWKNPQFTNCASVGPSGGMDASLTMKLSGADTVTEVKLDDCGSSTVDLKYSNPMVKGLTMGGRFERKNAKAVSDSIEVNAEYKKSEQFHGRIEFHPLTTQFKGSAVIGYKNMCRFGGHLAGRGMDIKSLKYALGCSYCKPDNNNNNSWLLSLKTAPHNDCQIGKIVANIHGRSLSNSLSSSSSSSSSSFSSSSFAHKLPSELAAEATHSLVDGSTNIIFGGKWFISPDSRDTSLKAKVSQNAKVAVVLTHRFSDSLTAAVGTQVNAMNIKDSESLKYGVKLNVVA